MHQIILAAALAALAAGSEPGTATADGAKAANDAAASPAVAVWSIYGTSWEFTHNGTPMQESIDADGNYVINSGSTHIDHGTATTKDGKICVTSAMRQDGEMCWTLPPLEIGASGEAVSDAGERLPVKRVPYSPATM